MATPLSFFCLFVTPQAAISLMSLTTQGGSVFAGEGSRYGQEYVAKGKKKKVVNDTIVASELQVLAQYLVRYFTVISTVRIRFQPLVYHPLCAGEQPVFSRTQQCLYHANPCNIR